MPRRLPKTSSTSSSGVDASGVCNARERGGTRYTRTVQARVGFGPWEFDSPRSHLVRVAPEITLAWHLSSLVARVRLPSRTHVRRRATPVRRTGAAH